VLTRAGVVSGGLALAAALGVKAFYSQAGADQLVWILAPSSYLARVLGGVELRYEDGAGFISHVDRLVVGTPCAGVNFLVVAFLTLVFAFGARFPGLRARLGWLAASLVIAYLATIVTNGVRIAISARLFAADIYGGAVTPARVHRIAGTALYYGSLLALCLAVGTALKTRGRRLVPLVAYVLVSVGIPLVGRAWAADGARFAEHAAWVVGTAGVLTALAVVPGLVRDRLQWRT